MGVLSGQEELLTCTLSSPPFRKVVQQRSHTVGDFSAVLVASTLLFLFAKAQSVDSCIFLDEGIGFALVIGEGSALVYLEGLRSSLNKELWALT